MHCPLGSRRRILVRKWRRWVMLKRNGAAASEPLKKSAWVVGDEDKELHSGPGTAHDEIEHRQPARHYTDQEH